MFSFPGVAPGEKIGQLLSEFHEQVFSWANFWKETLKDFQGQFEIADFFEVN